jgi:ankyrin repeat protein
VRWLLAAGSNPSMLNAVGSTALHAAAAHGHTDVLAALLDQSSCSADIVNEDGDSALQVQHFLVRAPLCELFLQVNQAPQCLLCAASSQR